MNTSKAAVLASSIWGKILSIFGYIVGASFLLVIGVGLSALDEEGAAAGMTMSLIILALAIFAIIKGAQIKRRIKRFKTYVGLISMEHMTSLENIAGSTSQSLDFVRKDIQKMIDKRYFANAYISKNSNQIIIGGAQAQVQPQAVNYAPVHNYSLASENVKCPGCGAMNMKQTGVVATCEYCGSAIK